MASPNTPVKYVGNPTFAHGHIMDIWENMHLVRSSTNAKCAARSSTMPATCASTCSYIQVKLYVNVIFLPVHTCILRRKYSGWQILQNCIIIMHASYYLFVTFWKRFPFNFTIDHIICIFNWFSQLLSFRIKEWTNRYQISLHEVTCTCAAMNMYTYVYVHFLDVYMSVNNVQIL